MHLKGSGVGFEVKSSYIQNLLQLLKTCDKLRDLQDCVEVACGNLWKFL